MARGFWGFTISPLDFCRSQLNLTSSAVSSRPATWGKFWRISGVSWNLTPGRSFTTYVTSSTTSGMDWARSGAFSKVSWLRYMRILLKTEA